MTSTRRTNERKRRRCVRAIRQLDKLVDVLANGKDMDRILRQDA